MHSSLYLGSKSAYCVSRWRVRPLARQTIGASDRWRVRPLAHQTVGASDRWRVRPLARQTIDASDGSLVPEF